MIRVGFVRLKKRRAVSTMIGGIIILTVLLTALGTMVFVNQQFDSYQTTVNKMSQKDIDRFSENLIGVFPGLSGPVQVSGCGGTCNQYNMTMNSLSGIGIQVVRIYINSTGSGCTSLCILDPATAPTSYKFRMSDRFVNPGEALHSVLFWLPSTVTLPNPPPPSPGNTILVVTARGRVFSFQWPFVGVQSGVSLTTGVMKIAYQGTYNSANEYSTYPNFPYCHGEPSASYPAPPGTRETLTGITGVTGNSLTFVNPWIIDSIIVNTGTTLYFYTNVINTRQTAITVTGATLLLNNGISQNQQYYIVATLFGVYYLGTFYAAGSSPSVPPNQNFYVIFKTTVLTYSTGNAPMFFIGNAALTNQAKDGSYFSGEILLDGLWVKASC